MAKPSVPKAVIAYREAYEAAEKASEERRSTMEASEAARRASDTANHNEEMARGNLLLAITAK